EHNLDYDRLLDSSPYKEAHRLQMIQWGERKRESDPGYFCHLATEEQDKPVWLVSDCRRPSDVEYFKSHYSTGPAPFPAYSCCVLVRVSASDEGWGCAVMAVGGDVSILDINDLDSILTELDQGQFSEVKWEDFGLKAGLSQNTLEKIKTDSRGDTHQCLKKCLSCWLRREDNIDDKGKPSWRRLAEILEELGERALADTIRGRRGVSSEEQQVCPVPTSGHSISLAKPLEKQFQQMLIEFLNILTRFVNQVFKRRQRLKDVKTCLAGIGHNQRNKKEIDEVHNESGLMYLLRSYCSLREFSIVTSLAENMKMTDM
uniref:Phosphomevalonate kinase n=1 Tax=Amphimedon queenslandica TaxID=400682 RepID=A0A1X7T081_AMPQE